jgi:hypothetical protein
MRCSHVAVFKLVVIKHVEETNICAAAQIVCQEDRLYIDVEHENDCNKRGKIQPERHMSPSGRIAVPLMKKSWSFYRTNIRVACRLVDGNYRSEGICSHSILGYSVLRFKSQVTGQ